LAWFCREKTGADISRAMDWNRYRSPVLGQDVVAPANTIHGPTGRFQLRDGLMACHLSNDRSDMVYEQPGLPVCATAVLLSDDDI
jgi:hypothetical protein